MKLSNDILSVIIFILLILLVVYAIYVFFRPKYGMTEGYRNTDSNKTVVLLKTHVWNDDLEKFASKIKYETSVSGIDFYILMHCDKHQIFNEIKNDELKKHILIFGRKNIEKVYDAGFYGMWLSNHWILMWFYKQFKDKYQYFWTIEYDVRISGDGTKIWNYKGNEDFLYPIKPFKDPKWRFKNHYVGAKMKNDDKYYGYLQLTRFSNRFLRYLDQHFTSGENGQDELIIFSLFKRSKLKGSDKPLNKLIKDTWTVFPASSKKHRDILNKHESENILILHPVK